MIRQMHTESVDSYTNLNGLQAIKKTGKDSTPEALRQVAEQFESMFINMMMKGMRDANKVFSKDNYFSSFETEFHQEMLDNQVSVDMSKGKGIGLADVMLRQMNRQYGVASEDEAKPILPFSELMQDRQVTMAKNPAIGKFIPELQVTASKNSEPLQKSEFSTPDEFVASMLPAVEKGAAQIGLEPKALLAQAVLESGWGKHMMRDTDGRPSYNVFGIKADKSWQGPSVSVHTLEYRDGIAKKEVAQFRAYDSLEESVQDYVEFIGGNERYQGALKSTDQAPKYWQKLQDAGYATDPKYAQKIQAVYDGNALQVAMKRAAL